MFYVSVCGCPGFKLISYDDRCARLGIDRLELRRLRADLILCYKILHVLFYCRLMIFSPLFVIELLADIVINYFYPSLELTVENAFLLFALSGFGRRRCFGRLIAVVCGTAEVCCISDALRLRHTTTYMSRAKR